MAHTSQISLSKSRLLRWADQPESFEPTEPGGSIAGAFLHLARTVCRRAERLLVTLRDEDGDISAEAVRYVNRLSDALFVWSRWINAALNEPEYLWNPTTKPPE